MKSDVSYKVDLLKAMDNYVRNVIGDDDITDHWLMCGVPDGFNYDDLEEIAEDDNLMNDMIVCFNRCCIMNNY